jgi:hypothetical protein
MFGGPLGGRLFEKYISEPQKAGQLVNPVAMWLIVAGMGILSMIGLSIYDRLVIKSRKPAPAAPPQ